jgi:endonuclease/exonuclease/phosphatase family metal-dependent hydrolase
MFKHFLFASLFALLFCYGNQAAELRVLCYNIHIGIGMDKKLDIERTAKLINEQKPDLVALQEVDRNADRTEKQDQPALLEKLTGLKAVYGKTLDRPSGEYGLAILSRFPIKGSKMTVFPQREYDPQRYELRGLLETEIELENRHVIRFANTHLCHLSDDRRTQQVEQINELLGQSTEISILCGDFNAPPQSKPVQTLLKHWTDATDETPTFSSTEPKVKIDYIFYKPQSRLKVKEMKVLEDNITSDHRPVLVVFEILP